MSSGRYTTVNIQIYTTAVTAIEFTIKDTHFCQMTVTIVTNMQQGA